MPTWPGGPCPKCGEDMPAAMVHCFHCRTLLNPELEHDSVEIPPFVPLQEIESMIEVVPAGCFVNCPDCGRELKIARKYAGERVQCKFCQVPFRLDITSPAARAADVYAKCPYCDENLRIAAKYIGLKVACRFCNGKLQIATEPEPPP